MKKLTLLALVLVSAFALADDEVEGPMDERGVITLPGVDPSEVEPKPDPALQGDHNQYCITARSLAEAITKLRDQGAPVSYPISVLMDNGQSQFIWVARQVYWRQSAGSWPVTVGADVWARCQRENMTFQ